MASGLVNALRSLAWLRKNAALREDVPTYDWAMVQSVSGKPTVILEMDEKAEVRPVHTNAVGYLEVGWRVRVEQRRGRLTIVAAPQQAARVTALESAVTALQKSADGVATVSVSASAGGTLAVTFPAGRFLPTDSLVAQVSKASDSAAKFVPYVKGLSSTGMTVGVYSGDGSTATSSIALYWSVKVRRD